MKCYKVITLILFTMLIACKSDDSMVVKNAKVTFDFTHNWDNANVTNVDFNDIKYTNANGDQLSIERLRYLISDITFQKTSGEKIVIEKYQLVDLTKPETLTFNPDIEIPIGDYSSITITFGFDEEDNTDGAYLDLNSALWNVPSMLGGGYHYMQFEGKFIDITATNTGFQYHAIKAVDITGATPIFQETFIDKNLGSISITGDATIEIKMNIAEWFKNPNTWDLNALHSVLMPNFNAQIMINENGQNVFSLGTITQ